MCAPRALSARCRLGRSASGLRRCSAGASRPPTATSARPPTATAADCAPFRPPTSWRERPAWTRAAGVQAAARRAQQSHAVVADGRPEPRRVLWAALPPGWPAEPGMVLAGSDWPVAAPAAAVAAAVAVAAAAA